MFLPQKSDDIEIGQNLYISKAKRKLNEVTQPG